MIASAKTSPAACSRTLGTVLAAAALALVLAGAFAAASYATLAIWSTGIAGLGADRAIVTIGQVL